jgi:hypothetical protein
VERPDDTTFVDFDDAAGLRLRGVESHHRYFDILSLFLMPPDEISDIEGGQIVRVNEHRSFILEEIPVFQQRSARSQQAFFIHSSYFHRISAAFDIRSNRVRQVVKVDQNFDDAALAQQLDPIVEERPAVYLDKTLGDRIRDGAQADTQSGG